jgi:DNA-binding NtrC family response regulator
MTFPGGGMSMTKDDLLEGKRVLIVDDEPDVLETLQALLSMCRISKASGFEEARKLLEQEDFDIAILDIMGVDGYGLLDLANRRKILAVMLTAHALSPEETVKSYKSGAAYYVPKDKMGDIILFLHDVLEAKKTGKSTWGRWLGRFNVYYEKIFGPDWKDHDREFWKKFLKHYTY